MSYLHNICTIQAMYAYRNIEARSRNHCCRGKSMSILYSECVFVASVTQHAKRMRHSMLPFATCLTLPYFFHIISQWHSFREKSNERKMCVLIFPRTFVLNITHLNKN